MKTKSALWMLIMLLCLFTFQEVKSQEIVINYDEDKIPAYELPDPLLFNDVTGISKIFATELKINNETLVHSVRLGSSKEAGTFVVSTNMPVSKIIVNAHDYINYVEYTNSWLHDSAKLSINDITNELEHSTGSQIINSTLTYEFDEPTTSFTFKNTQVDSDSKYRIQLNYIQLLSYKLL